MFSANFSGQLISGRRFSGWLFSNRLRSFCQVLSVVGAVVILTSGCTKKVDDKDNSFSYAFKANVKGIDPIYANDQYSNTVVQQIFEGLLEYNYLKRPYTLQPAIADGMPVVTDNGLTHTFKIKKGIMFQDNAAFPGGKGRELTSQDFIYSFKRLADPKNASDGFWVFDGKVKGINAWADAMKTGKATYDTPIEGFQAPDKYTLVIKLNSPYYQLDYVLAMGYTTVVPHEAVEKYGKEFLNNPVGSGPFMLKSSDDWIRNSKITLTKNPTYRDDFYPTEGEPGDKEAGLLADAGKKIPFADKLILTELPEDQPRWQNFMKGNFDGSEIPNDNFDNVVKKENKKQLQPDMVAKSFSLSVSSAPDITYVGFNMKDPILGNNKDLRHAMSLVNDAQTNIDKFFNGRAIIAQSPIPPGLESYDPNYKNPYQKVDIPEAKELLKKSGYPDAKGLPEINYETLSDSKSRQGAEFFAQNMGTIGIKIKIITNTWPQFQDKIKTNRAQLFGIAWSADYPDPQNFYQLFYSKNVSPGPNDTNYVNPAFDKLYEQALNLPSSDERTALYKKMRDVVVEDAPWMFGAHRDVYFVYPGWVNNLKISGLQDVMFKYVRIDPKKRAELKPKL